MCVEAAIEPMGDNRYLGSSPYAMPLGRAVDRLGLDMSLQVVPLVE